MENKLADIPGEPDGLSAPGVFSRPCTSHSVPEDMCLGVSLESTVSQNTVFLSGKPESQTNASLASSVASCASEKMPSLSEPGSLSPQHLNCSDFPPETAYFKNSSNPVCLLTEHSCLDKSAENLIPQGDWRGGFQTLLMVSPPHQSRGLTPSPGTGVSGKARSFPLSVLDGSTLKKHP